jgi:predicted HicB family RNase H-like nuclease
MPVSERQKKYADKYIRNTFDELKIRVPKGRKAELQALAAAHGESLNGFVIASIVERERCLQSNPSNDIMEAVQ